MSLQSLPFRPDKAYAAADFTAHGELLGRFFIGDFGYLYRIAKTAGAIGATTAVADYAAGKALKWSDAAAFTVVGAVANTDKVCGVLSAGPGSLTQPGIAPAGPVTLASGDIFAMQVSGRYAGFVGSAASDQVDAGEYVFASTDADTGKLDDGGTTFAWQVTFGIARATSSTADARVPVDLQGVLVG